MDFSVEVKPGFLYGTAGRVWFELGRGFLHLVKIQPAFGLALGLVIDGFLGDDALFRQSFFGRFQLIRPFQYFFRRPLRLGGVFLLGLPAGHIDAFAGGLVIQRQAVAGHVLRYLVAGF